LEKELNKDSIQKGKEGKKRIEWRLQQRGKCVGRSEQPKKGDS